MLSLAHLDLIVFNYVYAIGSWKRLCLGLWLTQIFQNFLYCRSHKPKDIISGYVRYVHTQGSNIHKHCFNKMQQRRWFPLFSTRKGGLYMVVLILYFLMIVQTRFSLYWQDVPIINILECVYITCHKTSLKNFLRSSSTLLLVCVFHPQLVYLPDQALSGVRFQPSVYCAERFHN